MIQSLIIRITRKHKKYVNRQSNKPVHSVKFVFDGYAV